MENSVFYFKQINKDFENKLSLLEDENSQLRNKLKKVSSHPYLGTRTIL